MITLPPKETVIITHYGCADFEKPEHEIFYIGAIYFENGSKKYFYKDGETETENIQAYFDFLAANRDKIVIHWSMNKPAFGFSRIKERYTKLTGKTIEYTINKDLDLSEFLKEKYGVDYINRDKSRLNHLAILNNFSGFRKEKEVSKRIDGSNRLELITGQNG
jgi:hypothetical protein